MAQINKPDTYFNTVLYTGNGTSQSITGVNFKPDLVWVKGRSDATFPTLTNIITGTGVELYSNQTWAETTGANLLTSFDTDGFSVGSDSGWNASGQTKVAWNWLASNTTASNTDGSITSTVSANTTSGFSIVSYTGTGANATVGHGLGSAPAFIIFKDRSTTKDWFVYHQSISPATGGKLNLTVNPGADSGYFNNTATTSSVFSIGSANTTNPSGNNMIAYCFAEKKGFSKFGSYTGNGSADGTFIYTGFKPAWIMIRNVDVAQDWYMLDNKRDTSNLMDIYLRANENGAEATFDFVDFLSNGFKCRNSASAVNSANTFIYMAFAESPLVGTNNIPAVAR